MKFATSTDYKLEASHVRLWIHVHGIAPNPIKPSQVNDMFKNWIMCNSCYFELLNPRQVNFLIYFSGVHGEHTESVGGVYDLSNKRRLGLSEIDAASEMAKGITEIIKIEASLWGIKQITLDPASYYFILLAAYSVLLYIILQGDYMRLLTQHFLSIHLVYILWAILSTRKLCNVQCVLCGIFCNYNNFIADPHEFIDYWMLWQLVTLNAQFPVSNFINKSSD